MDNFASQKQVHLHCQRLPRIFVSSFDLFFRDPGRQTPFEVENKQTREEVIWTNSERCDILVKPCASILGVSKDWWDLRMGFAPPFYRDIQIWKSRVHVLNWVKSLFTLNICIVLPPWYHQTLRIPHAINFQRSASCDRFLVEGSEREIKCVWSLREWVPRRRSNFPWI